MVMRRFAPPLIALAAIAFARAPAAAEEWYLVRSHREIAVAFGKPGSDAVNFSVDCIRGSGRGTIRSIPVGQRDSAHIPIRLLGPRGSYDLIAASEYNLMSSDYEASADVPRIADLINILFGIGTLTVVIEGEINPLIWPLDEYSTGLFETLQRACLQTN